MCSQPGSSSGTTQLPDRVQARLPVRSRPAIHCHCVPLVLWKTGGGAAVGFQRLNRQRALVSIPCWLSVMYDVLCSRHPAGIDRARRPSQQILFDRMCRTIHMLCESQSRCSAARRVDLTQRPIGILSCNTRWVQSGARVQMRQQICRNAARLRASRWSTAQGWRNSAPRTTASSACCRPSASAAAPLLYRDQP